MKKSLVILIALFSWVGLCKADGVVVSDLKCENLTAPLAIDNLRPHFSWKLSGVKPGAGQRAYRIQVASDSLTLASGGADVWDSGRVKSGEQVMIPYGGRPLASRQQCWWRVMVWTKEGGSKWSDISRFGIGLLESEDIAGEFIGYPGAGSTAAILRSGFTVVRPGDISLLHVNSLGYYEVYVNGVKVGDDVLSPALSQLNKRSLWVTHDIAPYLREGSNEIAIWLGQGWYKKNTFGRWEEDADYAQPLVMAQIDVLRDGKWETVCHTDGSWTGVLSGYRDTGSWNALDFGGELVDARLNPRGMDARALDALVWQPVAVVAKPGHRASPQMCEPNRIRETITPVGVTETADREWLLDMGKVINGWFELDMEGLEAGQTVTINYSDEIDSDGNPIDQKQTDTYIARGGIETFRNKFNHHAFRYVTVGGLSREPGRTDAKAHLIHTDFAAASTFECSDPDLNAIHDMVRYTMLCLTYSGYMVDCPHLERAGYGGDGNSSTETLQTMYDVSPLYANWVQSWSDAMREGGSLPHVSPNAGAGGGGPYWCGFMVMAPWQTYLNYGDPRLIERYYPAMRQWLGYVERYTVDGLLGRWPDTPYRDWYLGDWLAPWGVDTGNGASIELVNNCFISDCLAKMERMALLTGKYADAESYAARRSELNERIHTKFFDPETDTYATGSQLDMTYPMLVGATPDSFRGRVEKKLLTDDRMNGHIGGGLVGVPVITKWAIESGAADWMYGMLKKRDYPGYLYMLDNGATATWEYWSGERSRVHNCYNGIGMWFYQALGGLRTDEDNPGYRHVTIDPRIPGGIDWCRVTKDTPYGNIELAWELEGGRLGIDVTLPAGVRATVAVPDTASACTIDGRKRSLKKDITLENGAHRVVFTLR